MKELLKERLHHYIVVNNPELLVRTGGFSIPQYINDKVELAMEQLEKHHIARMTNDEMIERYMALMTAELLPSKFNYLKAVIEQEYPREFTALREQGVLTSKVIGIMERCADAFEGFGFSTEAEVDNTKLRHAIIAIVHREL
ncbi:hypothetical protein [Pedobacter chitinilyticus]|uniref:Uncharacterized protein n=1 Tax=Pedobacter chitinilyticus TaxID=2233776 RepID=A0A3S3PC29_9SPHI|nr:hypothetical protein [Pedobacter chitinilyticus]RWU08139.1 hypothetical protein DPV69_07095 [Pedobacter chitinilyticus]